MSGHKCLKCRFTGPTPVKRNKNPWSSGQGLCCVPRDAGDVGAHKSGRTTVPGEMRNAEGDL